MLKGKIKIIVGNKGLQMCHHGQNVEILLLCFSGPEMVPTTQRPLLKDTLGTRNEDYVGGATC